MFVDGFFFSFLISNFLVEWIGYFFLNPLELMGCIWNKDDGPASLVSVAWLGVQFSPCRVWAQLLAWGEWRKVMLPEEHFMQSVCTEPHISDFFDVYCHFFLPLNFALPLEESTLTFRGTGLVLFILKWLSSLCSCGHCFWRWSLDLGPFLLTNSVSVMWGGHN